MFGRRLATAVVLNCLVRGRTDVKTGLPFSHAELRKQFPNAIKDGAKEAVILKGIDGVSRSDWRRDAIARGGIVKRKPPKRENSWGYIAYRNEYEVGS